MTHDLDCIEDDFVLIASNKKPLQTFEAAFLVLFN